MTVDAIADLLYTVAQQCVLPTDSASIQYNVTFSANTDRYDILLGISTGGQVVVQDVFDQVRIGGADPFLDLDLEADYGDVASQSGTTVNVQQSIPCDQDGDGDVDYSSTMRFLLGYNSIAGGTGIPTQISAPKCAISTEYTIALSNNHPA